jgi:DHA1 family multidrug resistance protein-like MFS transporter
LISEQGKVLQYAKECDPSLLKQFINEDKMFNIRHHGDTNALEDESESDRSERSSHQHNGSHRTPVDPEKGKDKNVIDWFGPADPDNPRN